MARRHALKILLVLVVYAGLVSGGGWAAERWVYQHTSHFDVPLRPGQWVHIHLGRRFMQRYQATFPEPSRSHRFWAPLHVQASLRSRAAGFGRPLVSLAAPTWPPALATAGLAVAWLALMLAPTRASSAASIRSRRGRFGLPRLE